MCERQFLTSFRHFYILDENRTCSISIRLDQKSRQFLILPPSILQNILQMTATAGPSCGEMGINSQARIVVFLWSTSRNNWMGKLYCVNANIFHHTQKI